MMPVFAKKQWDFQNTITINVNEILISFSNMAFRGGSSYLPFNLQQYSWGVTFTNTMSILAPLATVALAWYLRRQKRAMFFVICFGVLYYAGSVYLIAVIMVLVLIWALYGWGREIFKSKIFYKNGQ